MRRAFFVAALQIALAVGFFVQLPAVTALWPYPGTSPLTNVLRASILDPARVATGWAVSSGNDGALVGIGLDYVVFFGVVGILSFVVGGGGFFTFGILCLSGALFGVGLIAWSRTRPLDRLIPPPGSGGAKLPQAPRIPPLGLGGAVTRSVRAFGAFGRR